MSTNQFEIESVDHEIGYEEFYENYFVPELPVLIRGVGPEVQLTDDLSIESIREKIVETGRASVNTYWFEGPAEMLGQLADTPEIVSRVLGESHRRKNHCRLWLNGAGNVTPSHYDGNMLYVFNLQLKGRKEWRIVSPHTPLRNYPFSRAALFKKGSDWPAVRKKTVYSDFALEEGDMLYLPPMWHHAVKATAESNVNINWVATRKSGHVPSKTRDRELELLRHAYLQHKLTGRTKILDKILGAGIENYLENYAGVGWDFIAEQTQGVKLHKVPLRILKESLFAGVALKDAVKLKRQSQKSPLDSVKANHASAS